MKNFGKNQVKLIVGVLVVIVVMVTASIVLAYNSDILKPTGHSGHGDARWKVEFTSIAEGEKVGNANSRYMPYYTATYASFYVDFVSPGDAITYDLQISNLGTIDSVLNSIDFITNHYKDAIKYEIEGIEVGDVIKAGESKNLKIKVSYELTSTVAVEFDEPISISFVFGQAH